MSISNEKYDTEFYRYNSDISYSAAQGVVPLVLGLLPVKSVCDVGCGAGAWLRVFREHGITDIVGIDGKYVLRDLLQFPATNFQPMDLSSRISLPRSFDLAVSLEVAEHLPESRAASFVEDLTRLASVVLFSAAIPGQGGTDHMNEQWQTYWIALFGEHDYIVCDALRSQIWRNQQIAYYYRQNTLLFCKRASLETIPRLASSPHSLNRSLLHPEPLGVRDVLRHVVYPERLSVRDALWAVSASVRRFAKYRLQSAADRLEQLFK